MHIIAYSILADLCVCIYRYIPDYLYILLVSNLELKLVWVAVKCNLCILGIIDTLYTYRILIDFIWMFVLYPQVVMGKAPGEEFQEGDRVRLVGLKATERGR